MNIIDLFAGGGGASEGIRQALGVGPMVAINHDPLAVAMHVANHPGTVHLCEDLFRVRPFRPDGKRIDLLWASPDCTHHSRAKGGKPRETGRRLLAWVVVEWARAVQPRVICLENVQEFLGWGPLDADGHPLPEQRGETFGEFVGALQIAGYRVEWRVLNAADFGAPTSRRRLFLVARCDGAPVRWPEPTHGAGRIPWRTAAECIDWALPCPSIFERKRALAETTQRRIAEGIRRYVLTAPRPFVVRTDMQSDGRLRGIADLTEPIRTITTSGGHALVAPTLIQAGYGERDGQAPRTLDLEAPLGTVVAGGPKHALVAAFLARHYGGMVGRSLAEPTPTVTAVDHHSLVEVELGQGGRARQVAAWLCKFYGTAVGQDMRQPLDTVTTLDRFGLVTVVVDGEPYVIVDIGMRMLQPRELARAQGFDDSYILTGSKRDQVARIGNSVCPPVARAVVTAQFGRELIEAAA